LKTYWKTLVDSKFQEFLLYRSAPFFEQLKKEIQTKLKPDYLLIDTPSGISLLVGVCLNLLADNIIVLTAVDEDALDGTNLLAAELEARKHAGERVPNAHYVLSRYPYQIWGEKGPELVDEERIEAVLDQVRAPLYANRSQPTDFQRLHVLRYEPRIQIEKSLVIGLTGPAKKSPLARDYIDLFSEVVPAIASRLRGLRTEVEILRAFYLIENEGRMVNPEDNSDNVAFRVDTLLASLDSLVAEIARHGGKARPDRQSAAAIALFNSGHKAAHRFSDMLKERWSKFTDSKQVSIDKRLAEWCEFDSKVGFGRFHSRLKGETSGSITLVNNFLTKDRTAKDPNMCEFMTGYISRVLEAVFSEGAVTVSHDLSRDCGQYRNSAKKRRGVGKERDLGCVFRFRLVENND
jgi:hypothetical protein